MYRRFIRLNADGRTILVMLPQRPRGIGRRLRFLEHPPTERPFCLIIILRGFVGITPFLDGRINFQRLDNFCRQLVDKEIADSMFEDGTFAEAIHGNVIHPGNNFGKIAKAMNESEIVLDMSASIAVSRHLADLQKNPRAVSIFVSPDGNSLVLTAEDKQRKVRLDWLEMLHYRVILNETGLSNSFQSVDSRVRYGHSCRDATTRLPQDAFSTWAGIASKSVKKIAGEDNASVRFYASSEDGAIASFNPEVEEPIKLELLDWTIQFDDWLLRKLGSIREERLPRQYGWR